MNAGHHIKKCSCGAIISQCRCMDANKPVIVVEDGCAECKVKVKVKANKINCGWFNGN